MFVSMGHLSNDATQSLSSSNSLVVMSIFFCEYSLILSPCTMWYSPPFVVTGNEKINPLGTPYEPSVGTPIDTQSWEPNAQSLTWLMAALPAEAADEEPLASMISAPLLPTLGLNQVSTQAASN